MIVFPNAKINLGLQVVGKRPDGYHELETVFYPIALRDALEVVEAAKYKLIVTGLEVPSDSENSCHTVYSLLQKQFNLPPVQIYLHKAIPTGAGLGGGSADAAFLIKLLNDHFGLGMDISDMQEHARYCGADCAFFIENKPAFATGRGDQFEHVDLDLQGYSIAIVKPDIHVSTAAAFRGVKIEARGKQLKSNIDLPIESWRDRVVNDFEESIFTKYPQIKDIKDRLYHSGAIYASMSGSGSAVFGIFEEDVALTELEKSHQVWYC